MKQNILFTKRTADATSVANRKRHHKLLKVAGFTLIGVMVAVAAFAAFFHRSKAEILKEYGFYDPKVESTDSIIAAAVIHGLDTNNIVTVEPGAMVPLMKLGIPDAIIFDRQGNRLQVHSDKACNAGVFGFIPALEKQKKYDIQEPHAIKKLLDTLRNMQGGVLPLNILDTSADYYIFLSWSAWSGKLNDDHVKVWETKAYENKKAKLQVIKIDVDLQEWWPAIAKDSMLKRYAGIIKV